MPDDRYEKLREFLESRIEQLEQELQLYQQLLELLSECGRSIMTRGASAPGKEFRSKSGKVVARLSMTRDTFRLVFLKPVPSAHPYVKYARNSLQNLAETYEGLEYSFEERDGKTEAILVTGVTKDNVDDVRAVLEFVASKIASLTD